MEFEWDRAKAELNLLTHGVKFELAQTVLGAGSYRAGSAARTYLTLIARDPEHVQPTLNQGSR